MPRGGFPPPAQPGRPAPVPAVPAGGYAPPPPAAPDGAVPTPGEAGHAATPPPKASNAIFFARMAFALIFVLGWLAMLVYDIYSGPEELVPFWLDMVGVGVLAYALGINVAELTGFRMAAPQAPAAPPR